MVASSLYHRKLPTAWLWYSQTRTATPWAWKNMGNSTFHDENVNIWPKTSQNRWWHNGYADCWGRVRLFRFQLHALLVRGLLSTGCTLNFLRKVLKLKSEKTKLNLSVCHHRLWPDLGQTFTFQGKKSNLPYFPISSAQCSRCQLGCSGTQNFPCISGNCYRSILSEIRVWKSQKPIFLMVA